ncbi:MAG: response regulator [Hahellaceae bacterium]|nr:response regulator [Hahellaceae bacterium]
MTALDRPPEQILLVDDNPANLKILYETLDGRGYKLLVADSGEKALSIARRSQPNLVLLDIMMPAMDGFEVCRRLKADTATARSSVIFLSALDDTESKVKGFDVGGVDYISKPFQVREVLARVQNHLKIHALERVLELQNRELATDKAGILGAMSEGVYGLDADGHINAVNAAACSMLLMREEELLGKPFAHLHFRCSDPRKVGLMQEADQENERFLRAFKSGATLRSKRSQFAREDGSLLPVRYSMTPVGQPNHPTRAVVVFSDISDEIQREQELESVRANLESQRSQLAHVTRLSMMGEMAAGIAHEVNQPLTAIVNYSRLASRLIKKAPDIDTTMLQETLDKIQKQSERASQVIQHIRNFVKKPTEGKIVLSSSQLAHDILELAQIEARELRAQLFAEFEEPLPEIDVEPIQLQQVALNLIRNAMEASASQPGGAIVRFTVKRVGPRQVEFRVADNGPGVAESHRAQLFHPFFTTKKTGMGIGLTLCQSIVHSHGGEIAYEPGEQGGGQFYFRLPVRGR